MPEDYDSFNSQQRREFWQTHIDQWQVIPEVDEAICVGCGGCEHACPTTPFRAIYVDGNPKHKTAQKPKEKRCRWILARTFLKCAITRTQLKSQVPPAEPEA